MLTNRDRYAYRYAVHKFAGGPEPEAVDEIEASREYMAKLRKLHGETLPEPTPEILAARKARREEKNKARERRTRWKNAKAGIEPRTPEVIVDV